MAGASQPEGQSTGSSLPQAKSGCSAVQEKVDGSQAPLFPVVKEAGPEFRAVLRREVFQAVKEEPASYANQLQDPVRLHPG